MRSISNGLGQWVKKGLLEIHAAPPALQGPKHHLVMMHNKVWALRPSVVAVEQMTAMTKRQALLCQYEKYFPIRFNPQACLTLSKECRGANSAYLQIINIPARKYSSELHKVSATFNAAGCKEYPQKSPQSSLQLAAKTFPSAVTDRTNRYLPKQYGEVKMQDKGFSQRSIHLLRAAVKLPVSY